MPALPLFAHKIEFGVFPALRAAQIRLGAFFLIWGKSLIGELLCLSAGGPH